jgi:gliding motility-associated lipoprotein GldD
MKKICVSALLLAVVFSSCEGDYTPKPRGFFRIDFPEKKYQQYAAECPFTFEYPVYSTIEKNESPQAEPCWINVNYTPFRAKLHLSYKPVENNLNKLIEDSRSLVYKHTVKAEAINEAPISTGNGVYGIFYEIQGNTASSVQFYVTDSTSRFIRGSLYFFSVPQADSLAPVAAFLEKDITHMISTLRWK